MSPARPPQGAVTAATAVADEGTPVSRRARLDQKVCLVTGAGSGIGEAVVRRFLAEGARVAGCALPGQAQPADGEHSLALCCDVADEAQVRAAVQAVLARWGRLDVLVHCAGVVHSDRAADILDADWHRLQDINTTGAMRCLRAVLPVMVSQGGGAVVQIASVAAFNAGADMASYAASKAALLALTRSAAQAYGPAGVRVNALCPGWVDSPMSRREMQELAAEQGISEEAAHRQTVGRIALGRMASADEMAGICVFLASDEAAFITGTALVADGGTRIPAAARAA